MTRNQIRFIADAGIKSGFPSDNDAVFHQGAKSQERYKGSRCDERRFPVATDSGYGKSNTWVVEQQRGDHLGNSVCFINPPNA